MFFGHATNFFCNATTHQGTGRWNGIPVPVFFFRRALLNLATNLAMLSDDVFLCSLPKRGHDVDA